MYEESMNDIIIKYLTEKKLKPYVQIPFFSGKIDFVGLNEKQCVIIESKIDKWEKALNQAIRYGYCADKAYVALPNPTAEYVFNKYSDLFIKYNIGLLQVNKDMNSIETLLESENLESSKTLKKQLIKTINTRNNKSHYKVKQLKRRSKK